MSTLRWPCFLLALACLLGARGAEASLLSQQYTASWASPGFFPWRDAPVHVHGIENEAGREASVDYAAYLAEQARQRLSAVGMKVVDSPDAAAVAIDITIHLYTGAQPAQASSSAAALTVEPIVAESPAGKHEEPGDKTLIGRSQSLGVPLSDIWMQETPAAFARRLVEASVGRWGYRVASSGAPLKLRVRVTKLAMDSRAINALQFQADGTIAADLDVTRPDGAALYSGHYAAACTQTTASQMPGKEYLQQIFDRCVKDFQAKLESDTALRTSLPQALLP